MVETSKPPPIGTALHLDVSRGARADVLAGALLDAGLPLQVAEDALAAAGLDGVFLTVERAVRGGVAGTLLRFVDDEGRDLGEPWPDKAAVLARPVDRHAAERRKHPHRHGPKPDARTSQDAEPARAATMTLLGGDASSQDGGGLPSLVRAKPPRRRKGAPAALLAGDTLDPRVLVAHVRGSELAPIPKALALRALRRFADGLAAATGSADARIDAPVAVRAAAEAVVVCALLEALSPSEVTASPVLVTTAPLVERGLSTALLPGPSPWVLAVLTGAPTIEADVPYPATTPMGAALVRAVAHRFGPRAASTTLSTGTGVGALDVPGHAHIARALLGRSAPQETRRGDVRPPAAAVQLTAVLPGLLDEAALCDALTSSGATALTTMPVRDALGRAALRLCCAVGPDGTSAAVRLLWSRGAEEVVSIPCERRAPQALVVTVPVGRDTTHGVRVTIFSDEGSLLFCEPVVEDLRAAAKRTGMSAALLRDEAVVLARRLAPSLFAKSPSQAPPDDGGDA